MKDSKIMYVFYCIVGLIILLLIKIKLLDIYLDKSLDINYIELDDYWV